MGQWLSCVLANKVCEVAPCPAASRGLPSVLGIVRTVICPSRKEGSQQGRDVDSHVTEAAHSAPTPHTAGERHRQCDPRGLWTTRQGRGDAGPGPGPAAGKSSICSKKEMGRARLHPGSDASRVGTGSGPPLQRGHKHPPCCHGVQAAPHSPSVLPPSLWVLRGPFSLGPAPLGGLWGQKLEPGAKEAPTVARGEGTSDSFCRCCRGRVWSGPSPPADNL